MTAPFLTARWQMLAMGNYEADPALLKPRVPAKTELDLWNGHCYVSLVGFMFLDTRVLGLPVPFHINFEEVNLRYYVRYKGEEGWRRGVAFIKEIVPRWAIAFIARSRYNENYVSMAMRHSISEKHVEYGWKHSGKWDGLSITTEGPFQEMVRDSHEEFIAEHYWGYAAQKDGGTVEYRVEHPPWRVRKGINWTLDTDFASLYGPEWVSILTTRPASAFLAEGSAVNVYRGRRI